MRGNLKKIEKYKAPSIEKESRILIVKKVNYTSTPIDMETRYERKYRHRLSNHKFIKYHLDKLTFLRNRQDEC